MLQVDSVSSTQIGSQANGCDESAMSFSQDLEHKKVLVLGAGVTGIASARALIGREASVTIVDEVVTTDSEFLIVQPSAVDVSEFDFNFIAVISIIVIVAIVITIIVAIIITIIVTCTSSPLF